MKNKKRKTASVGRVLYYFWKALWRHKFLTLGVIFVMPLYVLMSRILVPLGTSEMIGKLSSGDFVFENYIPLLAFTVGVSAISNLILIRICDVLDWSLDAKGSYYLSNLAFDAIINQSMTFHGNRFGGSLTSQTNKLSGAFIRLKSSFIWDLYPLLIALIMTIGTIAFISPVYALIMLVSITIYAIISIFTFMKTRHVDEAWAKAENKQTGQLADSITNILGVKSYAREEFEKKRFAKAADNTSRAIMSMAKLSLWRNSALNVVNLIFFAVALFLIINGHEMFGLTVANVVLLYTLTSQIISEMWTINHILRNFNRALGDAKEMVAILDAPVTVLDDGNRKLKVKDAAINFCEIRFQHDEQDSPIFEDFSLEIKSGESVGLVGISGSGKTTLTKLLLRFADVEKGSILLDGQDISLVTQKSLRESIAYVPQETTLFHRSITENIAYGKPGATKEEIEKAARLANAHEFIKDLPNTYDTEVGERGVKLSGGQRQRIAIARAILKDAPILVLDEATSALDSESEKLIQDALQELMKGRTSLVIAHRLSTVSSLDRIVVLKNGKISEQGSHLSLLRRRGEYAKLWSKQGGSFLETDAEIEP